MGVRFKKIATLILTSYCLLNIFILSVSIAGSKQEVNKKVLILNSYNEDYSWTKDVEMGIISELSNADFNLIINREYMDSKAISSSNYFNHLYEIYKEKYNDKKYDLIISTDDDALNFLLEYGENLFPYTPIVFSGTNGFQDSMVEGKGLFTGVVETVDIEGTIDLGLKLHPNTEGIIIINDKSTTGREFKNKIEETLFHYDDKIEMIVIEDEYISNIQNVLKEYRKNYIILNMGTFFKDDHEESVGVKDALKEISKNVNLPIYTLWYNFVGDGVVGGRVIRGYQYGENVGQLGTEILMGKNASSIPIKKWNSYEYVFDHKALQRFHIENRLLPMESIIINNPSYTISKDIVYSVIVIVIMVLLVIILFLFESIIKRKTAEKELRKSKERYRKLVELCPDAIAVHNDQGKIIYANPATIRMVEADKYEDIINKPVISFVQEDYKDEVLKGIKQLTNHRDVIFSPMEQKLYTLKGKLLYVEIVGCPISYTSDSDILVIARDISERKKVEELQKKVQQEKILLEEAREYDQLKTEFFANLSHELKTPLNVILGGIQLLYVDIKDIKDKELANKFSRRTKALKQNCYRLLRLVNNLIDITKIDANYYELNLENHNIVSIIEDITLSVADYIEERDIKLVFDTEIEEKVIACDPDKIERIILNILSNSVKFTNAGDRIIVNILDGEEQICISIKDTGVGIKEDKKKIIFDRFRQADKSFTRNHEGSGIGLSIVKALVEMHGGKIDLKSEDGKGSEFIICIPVRTVEKKEEKDTNKSNNKDYLELINIEFSDIYEK